MTSIFDLAREKNKGEVEQEPITQQAPVEQPVQQNAEPNIFTKAREPVKEIEIPQPKEEANKEFPFEGENELDQDIERNISRGLSRTGETFLGMPGDLEGFARAFIPKVSNETFLPTSKDLQGHTEKASGDYLKAKNEVEKQSDDFVKDVASYMTPGSAQYGFVRNIGIPIAGLLAKEVGKKMGAGEEKQSYAKMGTMFLADLLSQRYQGGGAANYLQTVRRHSENAVPQGTTVHVPGLARQVQDLIDNLRTGGSRTSKTTALSQLEEFAHTINNDRVPVHELIERRKTLNEFIFSKGGFEFFKQPSQIQDASVRHLNRMKQTVIGALDQYGNTNPEFARYNNMANEGYATYAASNYVTNFLQKHFGDKITNGVMKTLLGLGPVGIGVGLKAAALPTLAVTGTLPVYQAIKLAHRYINSDTLRGYYNNVIRYALQGNVPQTAQNIQQMQKRLDEEDDKKEVEINRLKRQAEKKHRKG